MITFMYILDDSLYAGKSKVTFGEGGGGGGGQRYFDHVCINVHAHFYIYFAMSTSFRQPNDVQFGVAVSPKRHVFWGFFIL